MQSKRAFYERYGVEEYYVYDPDRNELTGWRRVGGRFQAIGAIRGWVSPRLGVRFELEAETLRIYRPDGRPFLTYLELFRASEEHQRRADIERRRADRLAERLRELGVDPDGE